jgi:hypothetical protein
MGVLVYEDTAVIRYTSLYIYYYLLWVGQTADFYQIKKMLTHN